MSEYIDRCKLIEEGLHLQKTVFQDDSVHIERVSLLDIPAADVRPVVPGWWEVDGHHIRCSVCSEYMCNTDREGNRIPRAFCPNCGAKMEES